MMKLFLIILATLFLFSCAHIPQNGTSTTSAPIILPEQPKRVAIDQKDIDKSKYPNTFFVQPPTIVDKDPAGKGLYVKAPVEGMVYWNYLDYNALKFALSEYPKWMDTVEDIIKKHNSGLTDDKKKSWWKFW